MNAATSVYATESDELAREEAVNWSRFSSAKDSSEFCASWLAILCLQLERVRTAFLVLGPDDKGAYTPAAVWPNQAKNLQYLAPVAERVLKERRGIVVSEDQSLPDLRKAAVIGYPIEVSGVLHGAVILDIAASPGAALQSALRRVHWASAWLVDRFRQQNLVVREAQLGRTVQAMDVLALAIQERTLNAAALAVCNELAARLDCQRASIGFLKRGSIDVAVISNTATFDPRMNLVRFINEAMDEVLDLESTVVYPPVHDADAATIAHAELASSFNDTDICSVPLLDDGVLVGVMMLERSNGMPFDSQTVELGSTLGRLLGPVFALKQENELGLPRRVARLLSRAGAIAFGPRHLGLKVMLVAAFAVGAALGLVKDVYRVPAKTVVEGLVQRAVVAPFEGHIAESRVRAGDLVKMGEVLCRLDDREIRLELTKFSSEREQLVRKQRQALAGQDRGALVVLAAQIAQAEAQMALVNDKLQRATLTAPIDGVVVSGDLSQLLGTPTEQGKLLFQIAPMDAYRIMLEVDERDVALVRLGQKGELTVTGLPDDRYGFTVQQVTPVAKAQDGRNFFRVEAKLDAASERIRPGMEGVGKIATVESRLIWIYTRGLVDWVRALFWKFMP
ncbi:HlyD family efflux transporter periplasmic adaptor subunit [Bosea sp. F3-2]|uniref:HlyD family efflux transporter periplasmic adaptor subunit n=1 Tax=Bosea sp. F3-2 TaxID=2599640 RepID=UPI0011EF2260|nr:HlyD family efflux transporter periplasmic adaptor subunit [Bosea sp. F3-2]QEL26220.1 HlyD family efflux transporter periplasmic adaptor subunit [Bosea sp. F3-2]